MKRNNYGYFTAHKEAIFIIVYYTVWLLSPPNLYSTVGHIILLSPFPFGS